MDANFQERNFMSKYSMIYYYSEFEIDENFTARNNIIYTFVIKVFFYL